MMAQGIFLLLLWLLPVFLMVGGYLIEWVRDRKQVTHQPVAVSSEIGIVHGHIAEHVVVQELRKPVRPARRRDYGRVTIFLS